MATAGSDQNLYDLLTTSKCYVDTVDQTDKNKVVKARAGQPSNKPASKIGQVAWYLAKRLATSSPPPPPPPPPPPKTVAPRTYNTAPGGEPSARFCVTGLPRNSDGLLFDDYSTYDDDGHDLGGRTTLQVAGLKAANEMDGRGPCDPYNSFPPWPAASYDR